MPPSWANDRLHFFKCASASTAKAILQNGTLRWSTRAALNVPFEFVFSLDIQGDKVAIRDEAVEKKGRVLTQQEFFDEFGPNH
jgi:hypothetical protein